jgi:hypothetical protein
MSRAASAAQQGGSPWPVGLVNEEINLLEIAEGGVVPVQPLPSGGLPHQQHWDGGLLQEAQRGGDGPFTLGPSGPQEAALARQALPVGVG